MEVANDDLGWLLHGHAANDRYTKTFTPNGQVRVEYHPPPNVCHQIHMGQYTAHCHKEGPELVTVARTQSAADEAIRRHKILRELRALRDETRGKHPRVFWRHATERLRTEPLPKDVRYRLKRAALGHRLRDSEDPRQLRIAYR